MMEPQHYYADVKDQHHDDDSSTEVESLVGGKQWQAGDYHNRAPPSRGNVMCLRAVAALKWVLVIGLQLIIIGLLARDQGLLQSSLGRTPSTSEHDVGGDITGWSPHLPTTITQFKINQTFAPYNTSEFFKPEVLQAWNELMPIGMGFQSIPNPEDYNNLPTPITWPNATVYTTSMTHQLHCLYAVVAVYSGMTSGHTLEDDHHWHMIHCFDYMRQAIMCSADMALEGLETTFPDHNGGSDGWDSRHVCKDPKAVRERLESVRAYDDQLIF
ncbi:repeatdomain containing protein [Pyrenophora tritici-repentis]|uniref:DUF3328 domain containing protein n=2 Tax=Pyrenophora tritici-repentis TaxID=45151 RepID=A0A2W1DLH2_9PLEO|nr:uncharacterized protein PTRG_02350 [Pyrenophora tritici-repentis Pt-1C-BFP]KAF7574238.1 DUF3328 domain containing protein [Pyrenophora tritici-repentis]EDU44873.1 conserved hypothetical protein [Pyrenophora tritici-repentis Pt-1C-BFP]KAG9386957.1 DUF3328 domain containing protein [Pyrenophora tritici-repentis]KAI0580901.1 DUF3328 domain-containing protein [Pyrenophora tritici-repentis]KAI0584172.1 DUF3328 domain-containing protein [Pyrenophora tritici-repentis]